MPPEGIAQIKEQGMLGYLTGYGGQSSGDMYCLMCYEDQYVWSAPLGVTAKIFIYTDHKDDCPKRYSVILQPEHI